MSKTVLGWTFTVKILNIWTFNNSFEKTLMTLVEKKPREI